MIATLLLMSALAYDPGPWTKQDTAFTGILTLVSLYDVMATRFCLERSLCEEADPVLSKHPDAFRLYATMALSIGLFAVLSRTVPQPYRTIFQTLVITGELGNVVWSHEDMRVQGWLQIQF